MNPWRLAMARYRRTWGRLGLEPGMLRDGERGFYVLPRVLDNIQLLGEHLALRARGRCIQCRMPAPLHKPDCYHNWRIRDDLTQLLPGFIQRRIARRHADIAMVGHQAQRGQTFEWHAITHTLLEVVQPHVTHSRSGHCRWIRTYTSFQGQPWGNMHWLLPDSAVVRLA